MLFFEHIKKCYVRIRTKKGEGLKAIPPLVVRYRSQIALRPTRIQMSDNQGRIDFLGRHIRDCLHMRFEYVFSVLTIFGCCP